VRQVGEQLLLQIVDQRQNPKAAAEIGTPKIAATTSSPA
jgi:hypothetical protein